MNDADRLNYGSLLPENLIMGSLTNTFTCGCLEADIVIVLA